AFPSINYTYSQISFDGGYGSLRDREATKLGHGALNDARRNLFTEQSAFNSKKRALLVIVQMVSEEVRIKYIEHLIQRNMLRENLNFIPDPMAISMEKKWSGLSEQVQWSGESRVFLWEIPVRIPVVVGADEQCSDGEPTINIIGRDGHVVDVKDEQYNNRNPIILCVCGNAK
nr:ribosome-inactivating protein [Tanacetum cinerariifolium]GFA89110.1 ribosome-inactivating protein [Tanacetum cinerariifolium]